MSEAGEEYIYFITYRSGANKDILWEVKLRGADQWDSHKVDGEAGRWHEPC